jgi:hypothetical protein
MKSKYIFPLILVTALRSVLSGSRFCTLKASHPLTPSQKFKSRRVVRMRT